MNIEKKVEVIHYNLDYPGGFDVKDISSLDSIKDYNKVRITLGPVITLQSGNEKDYFQIFKEDYSILREDYFNLPKEKQDFQTVRLIKNIDSALDNTISKKITRKFSNLKKYLK